MTTATRSLHINDKLKKFIEISLLSFWVGFVFVLSGCGVISTEFVSSRKTSDVVDRLEVVSGNSQQNYSSLPLASPIVVRAVNASGQPVSGIVVTFFTLSGSLSPLVATTNAMGLATTYWTLGALAGPVVGTASVDAVQVSFNATVLSGSVSSTLSTVTATPTQVVADGAQTSVVMVTLLDNAGNPVGGKTVSMASSRGGTDTITPASGVSSALGIVSFQMSSSTLGTSTVTVTDVTDSLVLSTTRSISFIPGAVTHFAVSGAPASKTAGVSFSVTIVAKDALNNTVSDYVGGVHFTSTDLQGVLPSDYSFVSGDAGSKSFSFILKTAGSQTIQAVDSGNGSILASFSVTVNPDVVSSLALSSVPSSSTAGVAFTPRVTALDAYGNTATSYTGTLNLTSTDGQFVGGPVTLVGGDAGTKTFSANLKTAGNQKFTITDGVVSALTKTSSFILVGASTVTKLSVSGYPTSTVSGLAHPITVTAQDAFNNTGTSYTGQIAFTSTDGAAVLPPNSTFSLSDAGQKTFSVILKQTGTRSITATDTVTGSINGSQTGITVTPAAAISFSVTSFVTPSVAGAASSVQVTALDASSNPVTTYTGSISFLSSDPLAVLPSDYTFTLSDNGTKSFPITLKTSGVQSITVIQANDNTVNGSQTGIQINAASASSLVLSGFPSSVTAGSSQNVLATLKDIYGNVATGYTGTLNWSSTDVLATLPSSVAFTGGDAGVKNLSVTLKTAGTKDFTATDSVVGALTQTVSGVTVSASTADHLVLSAGDGQSTVVGTAVAIDPKVQVVDAYGNGLSGIPLTFTVGSGSGHVGASVVSSDTAGFASTSFTLGSVAGSNSLIVGRQTSALPGSPATLTIYGTGTVASPSAAQSTLAVSPSTAPADGSSTITITLTLKDSFGNAVSGYSVSGFTISSTGTGNTIPSSFSGTTNGSGQATVTMTSTVAQAKTISLTNSGWTGLSTSAIFTPGSPSPSTSTLTASPPSVTADGIGTTTFLLTLKDANGNTLPNYTIPDTSYTLSSSGTLNSLSAGYFSGTTNGSGQVTLTMTSTKAEVKTVAMTKSGWTGLSTSVTFVAGAASPVTSTLTASPTSITADGSSTTTLTLTLKDVNGNALASYLIPDTSYTVSSTGTANTLSANFFSGTTNASGQVTLTMRSTKAESKTVSMTKTSWTGLSAAVTFVPGSPSPSTSTIATSLATVPSDGLTTATITVTIRDANSNPISGFSSSNLTLAASGGGTVTLVALSGSTDAAGQMTTTIKSSTNQANVISVSTATPASLTGISSVNVTFVQLQISIAAASTTKGSSLTFTVTQNYPSAGITNFSYASSNGTALSGTHYTVSSGSGSIAAGTTTTSIVVSTLDTDATDYASKTMTETISSASNSAIISSAAAVGTIVDTTLNFDFSTLSLPASLTFSGPAGAAYFNSSGTLVYTASTTSPRFSYDPLTGDLLGLLTEPKSTNFLASSEDLNFVSLWPRTGLSLQTVGVNTTATTTPVGDNSAEYLYEDSSTGVHNLNSININGMLPGSWNTFTLYVKPAVTNPRNFLVLQISDATTPANVLQAGFNLQTGAVVGASNLGAATYALGSTQLVGNGWIRLRLSGVVTPTETNLNPMVVSALLSTDGTTTSYSGDGASGVYVWGAQFEGGYLPTSYIPTNAGVAVERSADLLTLGTSDAGGAWFAQTNSYLVDFSLPEAVMPQVASSVTVTNSFVQFPYLFGFPAASTLSVNNVVYGILSRNFNHVYKADGSSSIQASATNASISSNYMFQFAAQSSTSTGVLSSIKNGSAATTTAGVTAMSTAPLTKLDLSGNSFPSGDKSGMPKHLMKMTFRPFFLSVAATQTMTSNYSTAAATAAQSTVTSSASTVTANGSDTAVIIVTLKTAGGSPVQGKTVTLAQTSGTGATISVASGKSNYKGRVAFVVKSSTIGSATFTATDSTDSITVTQTATINFN